MHKMMETSHLCNYLIIPCSLCVCYFAISMHSWHRISDRAQPCTSVKPFLLCLITVSVETNQTKFQAKYKRFNLDLGKQIEMK